MEGEPTPRVCEACRAPDAAVRVTAADQQCRWCTDGFQDQQQQLAWRRVRARVRGISASYSFVEETVHDFVRRLNRINNEEAISLATKGLLMLQNYLGEDEGLRAAALQDIETWRGPVMDLLQASGVSAYGPMTIPPPPDSASAADTEPSPPKR